METERDIQLKDHTTFHIGGKADFFMSVSTIAELESAVKWGKEKNLPITVIGGGSNMLVSDEGIRGLVIKIAIVGIEYEKVGEYEALVHVGAGVTLDDLVRDTVEKGYWGLENLSAIPGTVGATPIQNVGAYGIEVSSRITAVDAYDIDTETIRTFLNDECTFGYRSSYFKSGEGKKYAITRVSFRLTRVPAPHLEYADLRRAFADRDPSQRDIRDMVIQVRGKKFPDWNILGTAGSFFKNPFVTKEIHKELKAKYPDLPGYENADGTMKIPLGWVLDKVIHIRGARKGNVGSYEGQSLVVVNYGDATAEEVNEFASMIEKKVFETLGVHIEREVRMYL